VAAGPLPAAPDRPPGPASRACVDYHGPSGAATWTTGGPGAAPGGDDRNERRVGVQWRFTTADARIKLHQLYPSIQV